MDPARMMILRELGGEMGAISSHDVERVNSLPPMMVNNLQQIYKQREKMLKYQMGPDTDVLDNPDAMGFGGGYSYRGEEPSFLGDK